MAMTPVRRQPPSSDAGSGKTLASVLHQNAQVEAKVEECAEEMSAIHAMLEGELSSLHPSNNRERALGQSKQVTERIAACAEDLHCVNVRWSQVRSICAQIDLLEAQTELARVKEERNRDRYFAFHDSLTGLPNPKLVL